MKTIFDAIDNKDIEAVRLLIKNGADVNAKNDQNITPINYIIKKLKLMNDVASEIDTKSINRHVTVYISIISLLVDHAFDDDVKDSAEI